MYGRKFFILQAIVTYDYRIMPKKLQGVYSSNCSFDTRLASQLDIRTNQSRFVFRLAQVVVNLPSASTASTPDANSSISFASKILS